MARELPIPPAAHADPDAQEILRVWLAAGAQHVAVAADAGDDRGAWGALLAQLALQVARATTTEGDLARTQAEIRAAFDAEWVRRTALRLT